MTDHAPPNGFSSEQVAYMLFERIAHAEGKTLQGPNGERPTREWILATYAECLVTVCNPGIKWKA
jgi:hypothetical protein